MATDSNMEPALVIRKTLMVDHKVFMVDRKAFMVDRKMEGYSDNYLSEFHKS